MDLLCNSIPIDVWEVFDEEGRASVAFLNEQSARNTKIINKNSILCKTTIRVNKQQYNDLSEGKHILL